MRARQLVLPARQSKLHPEIEFSIHRASTLFWKSDVKPVFPEAPPAPPRAASGVPVDPEAPGCFVVVTFQAARGVMVSPNEVAEAAESGTPPSAPSSVCPLICKAPLEGAADADQPQSCGLRSDDDGTKLRVVAGNTTSSTGGCCMITSNSATMEFKDLSRDKFYAFMRDLSAAVRRIDTQQQQQVIADDSNGALINNSGCGASPLLLLEQQALEEKENAPCIGGSVQSTTAPLVASSVWVDWTDPANGMPALSRSGPSVYSEVDAIEQLLSTPIVTVGFATGLCRLLSHPVHGLDVYPASGFVAGVSTAALIKALEGI